MASRHKVVNTAHFPIIEVLEDSTVQKAIQNKGVQLPVATEVFSLLAHNEPIQTLTYALMCWQAICPPDRHAVDGVSTDR